MTSVSVRSWPSASGWSWTVADQFNMGWACRWSARVDGCFEGYAELVETGCPYRVVGGDWRLLALDGGQ